MNKTENIKLLIMDCDGVLSDGKVIYTEKGWESKAFAVSDGLGLSLLRFTDIKTAVITGRNSHALKRRCQDLDIDFLFQGVKDKVSVVNEILESLSLDWQNTAFIGDDWNDFHLLKKVALSGTPQQAPKEIKEIVDFISQHRGGDGAVREFIEYILHGQGIFDNVIKKFLDYTKEEGNQN
ncbi:MAG: HAD hydrolase family protein [Candidatus Cloacimonetes bacterium]|nr:HAD hydrolase family protein [Candidatus Cloacimonadota bacterium]